MAEFEAKITGIADLSKAKQDFDAFKKSMEQPIKITVDASGLNAIWGNFQKQAQQSGVQVGNSLIQGVQKTIRGGSNKVTSTVAKAMFDGILPDKKILFNSGGLDAIGTYSDTVKAIKDQFQDIEKSGGFLKNFKFGEDFKSFTAEITNGANATIKVLGTLGDILNDKGEVVGHRWNMTNQSYIVDMSNSMKQAQTEAQKLTIELDKVGSAFSSGTFDANIAKMEQGLMGISNKVGSDLVKKASDAAAEYYRITQEIASSLNNPNQQGALQGQQLVDAYKQAEVALKTYNNAMTEVRANTQKMLAEGVGARNANQVETWAKNNSKALKQYGDQLQDLANKMRSAQTQGELNGYINQFKNLKSEITAAGLGGLSFGDQIKKAFVHIGEFTGIYALTSQIRQIPREMIQEVIKIDTAMTELRKVSTASASEISSYFDQAADSAYKYGQTIDGIIESTASWTRLGYELKDATELADVTAELAQVGSGLNVDTATEGLQATIRGFSLAADEAKRVGDMINYVADTEPIDAIGIINGLEKSSAAMSEANNSLEETIGLITATTSVTQDASSAGNAWRTISMRIRGAKTELEAAGEDTSGMVESVSKLREQVIALSGVDILEADEKTFKSTTQIVRELSQVYDQMQDIDQANLLELLAGKRGANVLAAALQNFDIVEDTIKGATTESVDSMDKQLEVYNQSIQASLDKFHVAFQELSTDIINSDFIKGIVDAGTMILRIIDELVKHIGVLGTALTGLGISKIFSTAVNGAKNVSDLSTAFSLFFDAVKGGSGRLDALNVLLGEVGASATGAGSAVGGMLSGLGAFFTNPVGLGVAAVGAVVGAGVLAYKAYKKQQEELIKQATETTASWNGTKTDIEQYKQQYSDLNKQLSQANLTESERISIKQQLLSLQNEISAKYGADASQLDLINGLYQTQLGLISQISAKEAERNITLNREAYEKSENEMKKSRTYTLNSNGSGSALMKQIEWIYQRAGFKDNGNLTFDFTGDATQANESINQVIDGLEKLRKTASESEKDFIDSVMASVIDIQKKNSEILDKNQDNYRAYLEQQLYSEGFGDELAEYSKRAQEYNDALFSGDAEKINEAKSQLDEYKGTVKEITDSHAEYGNFFDEVANSVEKTTEKVYQFSDIIEDGIADSSNDLKAYEKQIKNAVDNLKTLGLDGVDVQDILLHGGNGYEDLSALAKLFNPDIDLSNEDQVKTFADVLAQLGVVASGAGDGIDLAKDSFDGFMKSASASIDTLDKVNASLVNSFKSGGLSARIDAETGELTGDVQTILNAYKKELGDGSIDQLFERTADGIMVNRDALRALQAEQENTTKAEFIERIKEAEANLAAATTDDERRAWQTRLDNVKLLASAYDGATSAYQKWVDAQSMGEAGDQYDTIASTALKRGKELYDKGLVGTNEFRAIAQLYSDQDLALASVEELTEAYENGVSTVKKYFTEGQEGAVAFADKMVELGVATKEGDFYNFGEGIDTSQIADELDISVDLVEAAFKKLGDYGFDIHFMSEDQLAEFDTLTEKAEEAQDKLKELRDSGANVGDSDLIDIDLSELDTVKEIDSAIEKLNEAKASPEIDPESAEAYQAIIDALQEKLDLLSQTDIGNEVNFDNLDSAYSLLGSLQGRMAQIDSLNATSTVDIDVMGDDQVQLVAEQIANLPPEIKKAIGFEVEDDATAVIEKLKKEEVQIPVEYQQPTNVPTATGGTATVSVQYEQGDLPTVSSQTVHLDYEPNPINANVVTVLDKTAVDSYKPEDKDAKVIFGKDSSNPDNYQPSDKYATVNYSVSVSGASAVDNLPDSGNRYITYYINTVGSAPGNYKGTVSKSAFQGISHANGTAHANGLSRYGLKQDENSLINELGAEIVVRPSEDSWMIFNDGMPTFAQLRKGDVIFDAEQTKELLSKGWTKNSASIFGSSFVGGTAHARKVVGGGSFKKATSSSKKSSGGSGGGGGGNNSGGGGGDNSKANKEANDFKETLDKIEIRIDRLDRFISNFDTVASNVFNNLTTRSDALSKSLYVVGTEIKEQERAYTRYIKQANKVGLDSKLAAKVRKGEIDIQDIKNEDTWKKIEEYRKWWNSRHSIHLNAGKLRRHINYNARIKYA